VSKRISLNKGLSKSKYKLQEKKNSKSGVEDFDDEIVRTYEENITDLIEKVDELGMPKKNETIRLITKRAFNSLEFIEYIRRKEKIVETYICVYSIDYKSGVILDDYARYGKIGKVTFLISNLRNSAYRKKEQVVREKFIKNENIRLVFAGSHAKIICIKTEANYYAIETSANIAPNSRIEQYTLCNSEVVYNFHKNWIDNIEKIATLKEFVVYDFDGEPIKGSNRFKEYAK
jgi:hypothetical protein